MVGASGSSTNSTSNDSPSALVMATVQGSSTNPATSAKMQKMTLSSPDSAFSSSVSNASSKTRAPSINAPVLSQSGHGRTVLKLNKTSV